MALGRPTDGSFDIWLDSSRFPLDPFFIAIRTYARKEGEIWFHHQFTSSASSFHSFTYTAGISCCTRDGWRSRFCTSALKEALRPCNCRFITYCYGWRRKKNQIKIAFLLLLLLLCFSSSLFDGVLTIPLQCPLLFCMHTHTNTRGRRGVEDGNRSRRVI